jgi:import receptor subunit TOM70
MLLAILYLQVKQDPVSAEENCRMAVEADPLSDVALMQLAQLLCHQDKITEAISFYDRAITVTRTQNEMINIISCREAARAQLFVTEVNSIENTNI